MSDDRFARLTTLPPAQRWREQAQPMPIVVGIVRQTGSGERYLLIQRNGSTYHGQWALVGGKWDFGEPLPAAIEREILEETSLTTRFVALRGLVNERVVTPDLEQGAHFLLLVCALDVIAGQAQTQQEGDVAWFSWAEITALHEREAIIPSDYQMLQQFAGAETAVPLVAADMIESLGRTPAAPGQLIRFDLV